MNYQIIHTTRYRYNQTVSLCHNIARILIRDTDNQHCHHSEVSFTPQPDIINEYEDFFGNKVIYFAIQHEHRELSVTVRSMVEKNTVATKVGNLFDNLPWEEARKIILQPGYKHTDARQFIPVTKATTPTPEIVTYALQSFTVGRPIIEAAHDLMTRIFTDFTFDNTFSTIATPLQEVMDAKKGVCQDFAHLAIACLRSVGLPARYVSGYLETVPPPDKQKLVGMDASHAWFEIYVPEHRWLPFDPTNNMIPAQQHITIGWGRDFTDVSPLKGVVFSSGKHDMKVSVDVRRVG